MKDILITSSVLILAVFGIRRLAKGRINPILQYALWLIVVLRLLLPVPLWNSPISILNFFPEETESTVRLGTSLHDAAAEAENALYFQNDARKMPNDLSTADDGNGTLTRTEPMAGTQAIAEGTPYLFFIWIAGIVVIAAYLLFYQIKWTRYLRANRKPLKGMKTYRGVLSVYTLKGLPSPCLSGRNIYLTKEMAADERQLAHILAHEYCHYRHGDSLWILVRCILVSVYWFDPLVWAAAYASK